jgi:hypothetical protein
LEGSRIELALPADTVRRWAESETVAIEGEQPAADGRRLRILVEKDFACLKERPGEDDADAFPNPTSKC